MTLKDLVTGSFGMQWGEASLEVIYTINKLDNQVCGQRHDDTLSWWRDWASLFLKWRAGGGAGSRSGQRGRGGGEEEFNELEEVLEEGEDQNIDEHKGDEEDEEDVDWDQDMDEVDEDEADYESKEEIPPVWILRLCTTCSTLSVCLVCSYMPVVNGPTYFITICASCWSFHCGFSLITKCDSQEHKITKMD